MAGPGSMVPPASADTFVSTKKMAEESTKHIKLIASWKAAGWVATDLKAEHALYQVGNEERQEEAWFMLQNYYKALEVTV